MKPILVWDPTEEDLDEFSWTDFCDELTTIMNKLNARNEYKGYWYAEVTNFGWRSKNGHATFKAETGRELLQKILPKTDCIFKIFRERNRLRIQNVHHDSPVGKEWYTVRPLTKKEAEAFIQS